MLTQHNVPARVISEQYHKLTGLLWNIILLLFAGTWLTGAGYTLWPAQYTLLRCHSSGAISTVVQTIWGIIAATGSAVSVLGLFGYSKALISDADADIC